MHKDINLIAQQLFHKENIEDINDDDLSYFISKYPYSGPARFLLAKKRYNGSSDQVSDELVTAGLYFNNPLWFNSQLMNNIDEPEETEIKPVVEAPAKVQSDKTTDETGMEFQSYHTIDYFASQGIRLQQSELTKDRLGQQLKSFTEWLRSMKKLPSVESPVSTPEDDTRQQGVIHDAATSIAEKEVFTEAMAEVWIKQGNNIKAIEIYEKLSLQNPSKSAYFAAKIDQLK
jgi:hypothetical protein